MRGGAGKACLWIDIKCLVITRISPAVMVFCSLKCTPADACLLVSLRIFRTLPTFLFGKCILHFSRWPLMNSYSNLHTWFKFYLFLKLSQLTCSLHLVTVISQAFIKIHPVHYHSFMYIFLYESCSPQRLASDLVPSLVWSGSVNRVE